MKILYFSAEHCAPCRVIKPLVREFCNKHEIELGEIDAADPQNMAFVSSYNIRNIPVAIVLEGEDAVETFKGKDLYNELEEWIKSK